MGNRFERRFSLPPEDEPDLAGGDGATEFDSLPFSPTPEQAGAIIPESDSVVLYRAPEATREGYEKIKEQFVSRLYEAVSMMEARKLDRDADHFNFLANQVGDSNKPFSKIPLWYFDARFRPDSGRFFSKDGEAEVTFLNQKEFSKLSKAHDLRNHVMLFNSKPSLEAQRIVLECLGVEHPTIAEKGHFSTDTKTVRGFYEQLGPAQEPNVAYFHFRGTPSTSK